MTILKIPIEKHVGLKLLFDTKGSRILEPTSRWHIYRNKVWYQILWRTGLFGKILFAIVASSRRTKLIKINRYGDVLLIDCKSNIERDLKRTNLVNKDCILEQAPIRYSMFNSSYKAIKLMLQLESEISIYSVEDYCLFVEYCWLYPVISNFSNNQLRYSLLVAKDIYPFSAAFITTAIHSGFSVSVYSTQGMLLEPPIVKHHRIFNNIFVASKDEKMAYDEIERVVFYSCPSSIRSMPLLNQRIDTIGVLMGSVTSNWDLSTVQMRLKECVEKVFSTYNPKSVIIRIHPNEHQQVTGYFAKSNSSLVVHQGTMNDFISSVDLVICGGTSAALQVLEAGKIVLYRSRIDCYFPATFSFLVNKSLLEASEVFPTIDVINNYYQGELFLNNISSAFSIPEDQDSYFALKKILLDESLPESNRGSQPFIEH